MSIILGARSLSRLQGVHPDLVRVVKKAAAMSDLDFTVLEGLRTVERQKQLFAQKADRYWVGGTANWDGTAGTKWATSSGGNGGASVPTTADDVLCPLVFQSPLSSSCGIHGLRC